MKKIAIFCLLSLYSLGVTDVVWAGGSLKGTVSYASLNGVALHTVVTPLSPDIRQELGYLIDGTAYPIKEGTTFSFAPIQLPHGATITSLKCVFRDNLGTGYGGGLGGLSISLIKGPINTTDPIPPPVDGLVVAILGSFGTIDPLPSPDFQEKSSDADPDLTIVDNSKYGYLLYVNFVNNIPDYSIGTNPPLALRGCVVELLVPKK